MPNSLAHIGLQVPLGRALFRRLDARWLFLACTLPDLPWVAQRLARLVVAEEAWAMLRFYCTVQASLICCLLLAAALAWPARRRPQVFAVLALGSFMHLLLDSLQIKWGNGVLLLAPLSWNTLSLDLFWPESLPTLLMTLPVLLVPFFFLRQRRFANPEARLWQRGGARRGVAALFLVAYVVLPWLWLDRVQVGGLDAASLEGPAASRAGRKVAFDRDAWDPAAGALQVFTGWHLSLRSAAALPQQAALLSVRGVLLPDGALQVQDLHVQRAGWRDAANLLGLLAVALVWLAPVIYRRRRPGVPGSG